MRVRLRGDSCMNMHLHGFLDFFIHYDYNVDEVCESKLKVFNHNNGCAVVESDFNTNILRIAYATARTICSYHPDYQELHFDVLSSLFSQTNLVDRKKDGFLTIKSDRYERLRDFSKSTRIGELAQGINYLFIQEKEYPFIVDYKYFCGLTKKAGKGKSPDFVIMNQDFSKIGLFESKGEAAKRNTIKSKLEDATKQLNGAGIKIQIDKHIPCCTRFETKKSKHRTSINYQELNNQSSNKKAKTILSDEMKLKLIRVHYASWFSLIGDYERDKKLLEGKLINTLEGDPRYLLEDSIYWVRNKYFYRQLKDFFPTDINLNIYINLFGKFRIGISKNIVCEVLVQDGIEKLVLPKKDENIKDGYYYFKDGTVIQIL